MKNMTEIKDKILPGVRAAETRNGLDRAGIELDIRVNFLNDCIELFAIGSDAKNPMREMSPSLSREAIENGSYLKAFLPTIDDFCKRAKTKLKN